jgi:hypothetical protein
MTWAARLSSRPRWALTVGRLAQVPCGTLGNTTGDYGAHLGGSPTAIPYLAQRGDLDRHIHSERS